MTPLIHFSFHDIIRTMDQKSFKLTFLYLFLGIFAFLFDNQFVKTSFMAILYTLLFFTASHNIKCLRELLRDIKKIKDVDEFEVMNKRKENCFHAMISKEIFLVIAKSSIFMILALKTSFFFYAPIILCYSLFLSSIIFYFINHYTNKIFNNYSFKEQSILREL